MILTFSWYFEPKTTLGGPRPFWIRCQSKALGESDRKQENLGWNKTMIMMRIVMRRLCEDENLDIIV